METLKDFLKITKMNKENVYSVKQTAKELHSDGIFCTGFDIYPYWEIQITVSEPFTDKQKKAIKKSGYFCIFRKDENDRDVLIFRLEMKDFNS
jgi:hypothetical protein